MRRNPKKFTIETLAAYFKSEGCELLTREYNGTRSCVEYIARCGHKRKVWINNFFMGIGRYCKKCKKRASPRLLNIDTVRNIFKEKGCVLISDEYVDSSTPLRYYCTCGHASEIPLYRFDRGQGLVCPKCSGSKKKTINEVREIFKVNGCTLLSNEYKWNRQKVEYIAQCGHRHTIKASAFFEGEGRLCPKCQNKKNGENHIRYSQEEQQAILASSGCQLITPARTTGDKMVYIAKCGHQNAMRIEYFKRGYGHFCKRCYQKCISKGEKAVKRVLEKLNIDYASQYVIHTAPDKRQRLDFYIPSTRIAIEFNGRQHYMENHFFHGNRRGKKKYDFEYAKEQDERKRKWCADNSVRLIEIDGRIWTPDKTDKEEFVQYLAKEIRYV